MSFFQKSIIRLLFTLLLGAAGSYAFQRFTNYGSVIEVNDIIGFHGKIAVATTGGLYLYEPATRTGALWTEIERFPDLKLTVLAKDNDGYLWVGSRRGYLHKISPDYRTTTYTGFQAVGWGIRALYPYNGYLLVGSQSGFSVFDPVKEVSIGNAVRFDSSKISVINAIVVHKNVLYLGGDAGVATVDLSGKNINRLNFYDQQIWNVRPTSSPVTSFVITGDTVRAMYSLSAVLNGKVVFADSCYIRNDKDTLAKVPSTISCVRTIGDTCWIGTKEDFFYHWNAGTEPRHRQIPGMVFKSIGKITADATGNIWLFSTISRDRNYWWQGVGLRTTQNQWGIFNDYFIPNIGSWGDNPFFSGACVQNNGDFWVGSGGGGIKCRSGISGEWRHYFAGAPGETGGFPACYPGITRVPSNGGLWSKCDAIVQDSSMGRYLWFGTYGNDSGNILCYNPQAVDPTNTDYYRYFPLSSDYDMVNVSVLNVDVNGTIFAGSENGQLLVFTHNGHPLTGQVTVKKIHSNLVTVDDMTSLSDGSTWIVTGTGVHVWNPAKNSLSADEYLPKSITSIEAEGQEYLWLGTSSEGLIRYDWYNQTMTRFDMSDGLLSNNVIDLTIDAKNGYLWVATDDGLSRLDLAHSNSVLTENKAITVYPNPFSFSNPMHNEIVIKKLAPQTRLRIYDVRGTLVKKLDPAMQNMYEWTFTWKPDKSTLPGSYFLSASTNSTSSVAKVLIIP